MSITIAYDFIKIQLTKRKQPEAFICSTVIKITPMRRTL